MRKQMLVMFVCAAAASAATLGHIDDFEDGTTMGWFVPNPNHPLPPVNFSTGGPAGVDDNYLRLVAIGGDVAGSRMTVLSGPQWSGNYLTSGITHIAMDVNNFGPEDLYLRLLFENFPDTPNSPPDHLALSADAIHVPGGAGWTRIWFPVSPSALISGGFGTVTGALSDVDVFRIFHNPHPSFGGPGMALQRL